MRCTIMETQMEDQREDDMEALGPFKGFIGYAGIVLRQ